jgi:hypothetical protein
MPDLTNGPPEDRAETVVNILSSSARPRSMRHRPNITIPVADEDSSDFTPGPTPRGGKGSSDTPRAKGTPRDTPGPSIISLKTSASQTPVNSITPNETPLQTPQVTPRDLANYAPKDPQKKYQAIGVPKREVKITARVFVNPRVGINPRGVVVRQKPGYQSSQISPRGTLSIYTHNTSTTTSSFLPEVGNHVTRANGQSATPGDVMAEEHVEGTEGGVGNAGASAGAGEEEAVPPGKRILCTPASCYTEFSELQHSVTGGKESPAERAM